MQDEAGASPFPEGDDHGRADEESASVVFDEEFVRSARIHEPTAQERMLTAAQGRSEEHSRARIGTQEDDSVSDAEDEDGYPEGRAGEEYSPEWEEDDDRYDSLGPSYRRTGHARWHRTVAWILAVVMGVGVVALTVAAVYRGASGGRQQPYPRLPGNSRVDSPSEPVADPLRPSP